MFLRIEANKTFPETINSEYAKQWFTHYYYTQVNPVDITKLKAILENYKENILP